MPVLRFVLPVLLLLPCGPAWAEGAKDKEPFAADQAYLKRHFTKYEYKIRMRDDVSLFTAVQAVAWTLNLTS